MIVESRNFFDVFKNTDEQMRNMFSKFLRPKNFCSGTHLNFWDPIIILVPLSGMMGALGILAKVLVTL